MQKRQQPADVAKPWATVGGRYWNGTPADLEAAIEAGCHLPEKEKARGAPLLCNFFSKTSRRDEGSEGLRDHDATGTALSEVCAPRKLRCAETPAA